MQIKGMDLYAESTLSGSPLELEKQSPAASDHCRFQPLILLMRPLSTQQHQDALPCCSMFCSTQSTSVSFADKVVYQTSRALPQSQALAWEKRTDNFIWQYDERTLMLSYCIPTNMQEGVNVCSSQRFLPPASCLCL
ncbi:uncharacterized protein M6G45_002292 [Spheniscus humboldti]